jgi:hypothetical protein
MLATCSRGATEVVGVGGQHDLLAALPALEPERSRPDRRGAERLALLGGATTRHDLHVADSEHGHQRRLCLVEHDPHGRGVERGEAADRGGPSLAKLAGAMNVREQIGGRRLHAWVEQPRQRVDDVVRRHGAPVMEFHALAERERPREAVAGRLPELRQRRHDRQGLIELHEAVEDLLGHRQTVDVADPRRVQRGRIAPQGPPVDRRPA